MDPATKMLRNPVIPTYFSIALPWTMATMASSSAAIVDGIFVGNFVGANALAAVNLVMPLFTLIGGISTVISTGSVVKYAKYAGEHDWEKAAAIFTKSMIVLTVFSLLFTLAAFAFTDGILHVLSVNAELYGLSRLYLRITAAFQAFMILGFGLSFFVRVDGSPAVASVAVTGGAVLNILLDWLFLAVFGFGLAGAAYATGLSFVFTLAVACCRLPRRDCRLRLTRRLGCWRDFLGAIYNGSSELLNEISGGFIVFLINGIMIRAAGASGVAGFAVISYLLVFGMMAAFGFSDSLSPLVSCNMAAGKRGRATAFLLTACLTVFGIGALLFAVLTLWPEPLLRAFLPEDAAALQIAQEFLHGFRWMFLLAGVNIVFTSYFTGLHKPLCSLVTAGLRGMLLPLLLVWAFFRVWGIPGSAAAVPVSELLTFTVGAVIIFMLNRRHLSRGRRAAVLVHLPRIR